MSKTINRDKIHHPVDLWGTSIKAGAWTSEVTFEAEGGGRVAHVVSVTTIDDKPYMIGQATAHFPERESHIEWVKIGAWP